jgi:hypothetical protein
VELGFVERLGGKITLQAISISVKNRAVYLRLNILTYMASET